MVSRGHAEPSRGVGARAEDRALRPWRSITSSCYGCGLESLDRGCLYVVMLLRQNDRLLLRSALETNTTH